MNTLYPLGHGNNEVARLEIQVKLLEDTKLLELARGSLDCLEIGTGVGSNFISLQSENPRLNFTGVDYSSQAIRKANKIHLDSGAKFLEMDATQLTFPNESFDLVFSKLLLWSIGPTWELAVKEAFRVLKPGGVFYSFEPFDKAVLFEPRKPKVEELIKQWDEIAIKDGFNPFIGPQVPGILSKIGFSRIQTKFFPVLALSEERQKYWAICDNLRNFYFGDSSTNPIRRIDPKTSDLAYKELLQQNEIALVMDSFFVIWGYKI